MWVFVSGCRTIQPMIPPLPSQSPLQDRRRALTKTVCYRLLMVLAWLVVGDASDALNIGIVTNVVKTVTYYSYERIWDRISWGL